MYIVRRYNHDNSFEEYRAATIEVAKRIESEFIYDDLYDDNHFCGTIEFGEEDKVLKRLYASEIRDMRIRAIEINGELGIDKEEYDDYC